MYKTKREFEPTSLERGRQRKAPQEPDANAFSYADNIPKDESKNETKNKSRNLKSKLKRSLSIANRVKTPNLQDKAIQQKKSASIRRSKSAPAIRKHKTRAEYVQYIKDNFDSLYDERIQPIIDVLSNYGKNLPKVIFDNNPYMGISMTNGIITLDYSLMLSNNRSKLLFILSHEWGHRFLEHKEGDEGDFQTLCEQEKSADYFAGYILSQYFYDEFKFSDVESYFCDFLIKETNPIYLKGPKRYEFLKSAYDFAHDEMKSFHARKVFHHITKVLPLIERLNKIIKEIKSFHLQFSYKDDIDMVAYAKEDGSIILNVNILKLSKGVILNIITNELGHLLLGHHRPDNHTLSIQEKRNEMAADFFSAYCFANHFTEFDRLECFKANLSNTNQYQQAEYNDRINLFEQNFTYSKHKLCKLLIKDVLSEINNISNTFLRNHQTNIVAHPERARSLLSTHHEMFPFFEQFKKNRVKEKHQISTLLESKSETIRLNQKINKTIDLLELYSGKSYGVSVQDIHGVAKGFLDVQKIALSKKVLEYPYPLIAGIIAHEWGHIYLNHFGRMRSRIKPLSIYQSEIEADIYAAIFMGLHQIPIISLEDYWLNKKRSIKPRKHLDPFIRIQVFKKYFDFAVQHFTKSSINEIADYVVLKGEEEVRHHTQYPHRYNETSRHRFKI